MKNNARFQTISKLIDEWFDSKDFTKKRTNFNAFHSWEKIVGRQIAENTEPVKFYNDILVVNVKNSVWTQELQYMKPEILDKIRNLLPNTQIRDLQFKVGKVS